jgi:hypothetical protein
MWRQESKEYMTRYGSRSKEQNPMLPLCNMKLDNTAELRDVISTLAVTERRQRPLRFVSKFVFQNHDDTARFETFKPSSWHRFFSARQKIILFCESRMFITLFTKFHHRPLS